MAHHSLETHHKLGRLTRRLKIGKAEAVGTLELLWWAAANERIPPTGELAGWIAEDVAARCEWVGDSEVLVEALIFARFLDRRSNGDLAIHDYADWAPDYVVRRWKRDGYSITGKPTAR